MQSEQAIRQRVNELQYIKGEPPVKLIRMIDQVSGTGGR